MKSRVMTLKIDSVDNVITEIHIAHIPNDLTVEQQITILEKTLEALYGYASKDTYHADTIT